MVPIFPAMTATATSLSDQLARQTSTASDIDFDKIFLLIPKDKVEVEGDYDQNDQKEKVEACRSWHQRGAGHFTDILQVQLAQSPSAANLTYLMLQESIWENEIRDDINISVPVGNVCNNLSRECWLSSFPSSHHSILILLT